MVTMRVIPQNTKSAKIATLADQVALVFVGTPQELAGLLASTQVPPAPSCATPDWSVQ